MGCQNTKGPTQEDSQILKQMGGPKSEKGMGPSVVPKVSWWQSESFAKWQNVGGYLFSKPLHSPLPPFNQDPELHRLEACLAGCHASTQPTWTFPELASAPDKSLG